jgi:hypothetical protein
MDQAKLINQEGSLKNYSKYFLIYIIIRRSLIQVEIKKDFYISYYVIC